MAFPRTGSTSALGACASASEWRLPVLMYHAVSPVGGGLRRLGVPAALLEEQLGALARAGYIMTGLSEALRLASLGQRDLVALTFDDGYVDFLHLAVPILRRLDARATLYVPTGFVGCRAGWLGRSQWQLPRLLTYRELRECLETGIVEIGSHGHSHRPLDAVPIRDLEFEIDGSRRILENALEAPIKSFCYPHGYHASSVRLEVQRAGYDNACEVGRRLRSPRHRWEISRLSVEPKHDADRVLADVGGGGPIVVPAVKRALAPSWRQARITHRQLIRGGQ